MMSFLDLLVVVFMVLVALSLLAVSLMFLVRNPKIKKVCFYIVAALSIYTGFIGIRIGTFHFPIKTGVAIFTIIAAIASVILVVRAKEKKRITLGQIMVTGTLLVGIINAFV